MDRFSELSQQALQELQTVFGRMSEADIRPLADAVKEAKRIFLLGAGRTGLVTRAFAMRLMHLGKEAHWVWEDTAPAIQPGDLLICASRSGDVGHENHMAAQAKEQGARMLLVTASAKGRLLELADGIITLPIEDSSQVMGNLFEQALLLCFDMLILLLAEESGVSPQEMAARHRNIE